MHLDNPFKCSPLVLKYVPLGYVFYYLVEWVDVWRRGDPPERPQWGSHKYGCVQTLQYSGHRELRQDRHHMGHKQVRVQLH